MRAILVSVNYADLLAITLPYNKHQFDDVCVVTTFDSKDGEVAREHGCNVFETNSFYADGADFNKWLALEEGLDHFGREGWLCLMDADILWPKIVPAYFYTPGGLYTPRRRMWSNYPHGSEWFESSHIRGEPPPSECWTSFPLHSQQQEFAGYSQIFHASDPVLGPPPWHQTNWRHAGGADSFFQAKWPAERKIRPPFEVLHLGPAGENWLGRATPYLDGTIPPQSQQLREKMAAIWRQRRGKAGEARFAAEKIARKNPHQLD
jgi:hypothetical protein